MKYSINKVSFKSLSDIVFKIWDVYNLGVKDKYY